MRSCGSTEIAAQLDPEEWREVLALYYRSAAEAVIRFDGHVAKYLGDGVMAYFGWPEGKAGVRATFFIVDVTAARLNTIAELFDYISPSLIGAAGRLRDFGRGVGLGDRHPHETAELAGIMVRDMMQCRVRSVQADATLRDLAQSVAAYPIRTAAGIKAAVSCW